MNPCDEHAVRTLRYLDNDLKGKEREDFRAHLESCPACRAYLEAEKALSQTLHRSRPLYSAPAELHRQVAAIVVQHAESNRVEGQRAHRVAGKSLSSTFEHLWTWRILAPAAVMIALCLAFVPNVVRNVQAASYVEAAITSHRNSLSRKLPSGLESNSPQAVTAWFAGKVPFDFRLPVAESTPDTNPAYRLTGATLVNYKGRPAALVMYETKNDKISLLVDSSSSAVVAGGDEMRFGKLTFHYRNESSFRVITWTNHGLSYALVSSVSGMAQASCEVCHQNMADSGDFNTRP